MVSAAMAERRYRLVKATFGRYTELDECAVGGQTLTGQDRLGWAAIGVGLTAARNFGSRR